MTKTRKRERAPIEIRGDASTGTKERVLADIVRYSEHPDLPMVKTGTAGQIPETRNMNVSPSKMYEDGGKKIQVVQYLARRAANAIMPKTREEIFESLEQLFQFCSDNEMPVTVGMFAVWNGVTVNRINQIEKDNSNPDMAKAVEACKECIRAFLEICALDSSINPIVYFHHNKVYFGVVENNTLKIEVESNDRELSDDEKNRRIELLNDTISLERDCDGVYR